MKQSVALEDKRGAKMKKKSSETVKHKESAYHYREVLCPLCDHKFMDETHKPTYSIDGDCRQFYRTTCPLCNEKLLVPEGKLEAILMEDIPEGKLKNTGIFLY